MRQSVSVLNKYILLSAKLWACMADLIRSLLDSKPTCLSKFNTKKMDLDLPGRLKSSPEFISQSLTCLCGNELLSLEASETRELKGVCTKHEVSSVVPPIYVSCKMCKRYSLLFDPFIYGWKGEKGQYIESEEVYKIFRCTDQPGKVFVNYSYQNMDDYQTLLDEGIKKPQDYFDTFTVLYQRASREPIRQVLTCLCK
jgi:hypothetical protein